MNETKYIEKKLDELENQLRYVKKVKGRLDLFTTLLTVFGVTFGAFCLFGGLTMTGIIAAVGAAETNFLNYISKRFYKKRISLLEKAKKHVEETSNSEIASTEELNTKRIAKLNNLYEKKDQVKAQRKRNKVTCAITSGVAGVATGISAIFLPVVPVLLIGSSVIAGIADIFVGKTLKKTSQIDLLTTRINNISNDLDLITIRNKKAKAERRNKVAHNPNQARGKAKVKSNNEEVEHIKDNAYNKFDHGKTYIKH